MDRLGDSARYPSHAPVRERASPSVRPIATGSSQSQKSDYPDLNPASVDAASDGIVCHWITDTR